MGNRDRQIANIRKKIMDEINFIFQRIEKIFENDASGHDYWHTFRVYKNALKIAENEKCNKRIVAISALLHDVDDVKLFHTENFSNARSILAELNISSEMANKIINIINQIAFKGADSVSPDTIEGKIVQDADRLDALGAIGIARAFAYGGNKGRCMYHPSIKPLENMSEETYYNNESTTINHFYEKLFLLKDLMNTDTGRKLALERDAFMHQYIDEFMSEWQGI